MSILYITTSMFVLISIMLIFAYWSGGKVQEKYASFEKDNEVKFNKVYIAYLKNDPYQFLQRLYKPTKLLITDNELLILGKNRVFVFVIHMIGISSVINIKNITSIIGIKHAHSKGILYNFYFLMNLVLHRSYLVAA